MSGSVAEVGAFAAAHDRLQASRPAHEAPWLAEYRRAGLARFREVGFPSLRDEEWRHTNVAALASTAFRPATEADQGHDAAGDDVRTLTFGRAFQGRQIVLVNGRFVPELSSLDADDGLEIGSLAEAFSRRPQLLEPHFAASPPGLGPFAALNAAFLEDGALLVVPAGRVIEAPIHVVHLSSCASSEPTLTHPRTLIVLGRGAQARVVESYGGIGRGPYWTNAVTDVVLDDRAVLDHVKVQREREDAFHTAFMRVRQARDTVFSSNSLALGGALVRNDISQVFEGSGADCTLNGLFMVDGNRHTDTHTLIDHAVPRCSSRETYKGILDDSSRGVFHAKVRVRSGAQKTDAYQVNKNLLLTKDALVHSTPALEIYADDVKCKHGSTTGQLDPVQLFYLRSRGIGLEQAKSLLTYAFASDIVARVKVDAIRAGLTEYLQSHLRGAAADLQEAVVS
jgi:Fe-S cluster assembly protein SufD